MTDALTTENRSRLMGRVRQRNTAPELAVRSALHRLGYRFTVNGPLNKRLPGRPDIILPRHRVVVFVHGCFWHRHAGCMKTTTPSTRPEFWRAKFDANVTRDRNVLAKLEALGWRVLILWECETETALDVLMRKLRARQIHSRSHAGFGSRSSQHRAKRQTK